MLFTAPLTIRPFFQTFSSTFPQVVLGLLITFPRFPTLFNTEGKLLEVLNTRPQLVSRLQSWKECSMSEDFYPFVDSGDPAPDNTHLVGVIRGRDCGRCGGKRAQPGLLHHPHIRVRRHVVHPARNRGRAKRRENLPRRRYQHGYRTMKEQGGKLSLMIIRELVENFIHAQFSEPVISILDNGNTIRFADQGPGIGDKERAFEFGVTSADREKKRYIRGTGAGLPMVQQYVENAGGAIAVEDNLGAGTVVTVSVDPKRAAELEHAVSRGAAVRSGCAHEAEPMQSPTDPGARGVSGWNLPGSNRISATTLRSRS